MAGYSLLVDLPDDLRRRIGRIEQALDSRPSVLAKLEAVAELVERTVTGCDAVSVALVLEDGVFTGAASRSTAIEADLVQYAYNQGPCLTAVEERRTVRIDVLAEDERFAHFAPGAIQRGVQSTLSIPLEHAGEVVGSLNLYAYEPSAFTERSEDEVAPYARYAAELIAQSPLYAASLDLLEGLGVFVDQELHISRAISHLAATEGVSESGALQELADRALAADLTIIEIARSITDELPPAP